MMGLRILRFIAGVSIMLIALLIWKTTGDNIEGAETIASLILYFIFGFISFIILCLFGMVIVGAAIDMDEILETDKKEINEKK